MHAYIGSILLLLLSAYLLLIKHDCGSSVYLTVQPQTHHYGYRLGKDMWCTILMRIERCYMLNRNGLPNNIIASCSHQYFIHQQLLLVRCGHTITFFSQGMGCQQGFIQEFHLEGGSSWIYGHGDGEGAEGGCAPSRADGQRIVISCFLQLQ